MLTTGRLVSVMAVSLLCACGGDNASNSTDAYDSEVATSVVSGALNNSGGATVGWNFLPKEHPTRFARFVDAVNPIREAHAASWMCSGASLSPTFAGPGTYSYTPASCSINWLTNRSASSSWSGSFSLVYGSSCDATHPFIANQGANCSVTRTTAVGGNTRTVTGPDGSSYSINHDTNGAGTGWDSTVSPAPSNGGVVVSCAAGGCSSGGSLVINGSHLTGTVTLGGSGAAIQLWNHTISTGSTPLSLSAAGTSRIVSGSVTVQHNILKYTATATFNNVTYGNAACCFPTSGSVSMSFSSGPHAGKTESLSFTSVCGEASLTTASGQTTPYTLQHCM